MRRASRRQSIIRLFMALAFGTLSFGPLGPADVRATGPSLPAFPASRGAPAADADDEDIVNCVISGFLPVPGFCETGLDPYSTTASNADYYLFKLTTPCKGASLGFWEGGSMKLFRWEGQSEQVDNVRLEFTNEHGESYIWPGWPGYHVKGVESDEHRANFDVMELDKIGGEEWRWRLVDFYRSSVLDTSVDSDGNAHELRVSNTCRFSIKKADVPASQTIEDNPTQAFPGAGPSLTALSPCGGTTLTVSDSDPKEAFTYATNVTTGVVMEFLKAGSQEWRQYPNVVAGTLPQNQVQVNVAALLAEGQDDWQWRIGDANVSASRGNACVFHIEEAVPPPPAPGLTQIQSKPQVESSGGLELFKQQASYAGNCVNRPANTVCVSYSDGFVWLVNDSIVRQEDRGSWEGKTIRVAVGNKAEYHHVLGTNWVREVPK